MRISHLARAMLIAMLALLAFPAGADVAHPFGGTATAPCNDGTVSASPSTLWPPNHKMQTITVSYADNDNDGDQVTVTVMAITDNQAAADGSNEKVGSGQPTDKQGLDWSGIGNSATATDPVTATTTAQLRSERSGTDMDGRDYGIVVACQDQGGSSNENEMATATVHVTVPHDQGHRH